MIGTGGLFYSDVFSDKLHTVLIKFKNHIKVIRTETNMLIQWHTVYAIIFAILD